MPSVVTAAADDEAFSQTAMPMLDERFEFSESRTDHHKDGVGITAFPNVVEPGIRDCGARGVFVENGAVTGSYKGGETTI